MFKVCVAGHVCADLMPELPPGIGMVPGQLYDVGPLTIRPGGCVTNTGYVLAELGINPRTAGVIGDDDLGRVVVRELGALGLPVDGIRVVDGQSTSYSIVLEPVGMDRSFWHHTGASNAFDGTHVELDRIDLLHVGYPPLLPGLLPGGGRPLVDLFERARVAGITTSLDMAVVDRNSEIGRLDWHTIVRNALKNVDIFTPSVDDLTAALETGPTSTRSAVVALAGRMLDEGAALVMLSAGEDGLLIRGGDVDRLRRGGRVLAAVAEEWAEVNLWVEPRELESVYSTTGAGDAATAGLIAGLVNGWSPQRSGELAVLVASQRIQNVPISAAP